ncbi:unnamed protein product, partial [Rotaria sordida]
MDDEAIITFSDVSNGEEQKGSIPDGYKEMTWMNMDYRHRSYIMENYAQSGYSTSFTPGGSQYIVFFKDDASISTSDPNKTLSLVWIKACAAWNDNLKLTIEG